MYVTFPLPQHIFFSVCLSLYLCFSLTLPCLSLPLPPTPSLFPKLCLTPSPSFPLALSPSPSFTLPLSLIYLSLSLSLPLPFSPSPFLSLYCSLSLSLPPSPCLSLKRQNNKFINRIFFNKNAPKELLKIFFLMPALLLI